MAALELLHRLGEDAANVAAERADRCLCKADMAGAKRWSRIGALVRHIQILCSDTVH